MKKTSMTLLTTAMLSLSSFVGADQGAITPMQVENNESRLYIGPDAFWSHHHNWINTNKSRNTYFGGLRFGYEYLKPNAFYAATDATGTLGSENDKTPKQLKEKEPKFAKKVDEVFHGKRGHFWSNIEQRLGYSFSGSPSSMVSIYAAPGFHYEHLTGNHAHWWYGAAGVKALQQLSDTFHMGADVKATYSFAAKESLLTLPTTLGKKEFWGYEVGLPLEWKLGDSRAFDVQLRPYLLKFNVHSNETILGANLALGYSF